MAQAALAVSHVRLNGRLFLPGSHAVIVGWGDKVESEVRRRLGARIRDLRRERHLTQEDLAERAQLHPTHVAKIEAGVSWPSVQALLRLAQAMGVAPAELLAVEPDPPDASSLQATMQALQGLSPDDLALVRELVAVLKRHAKVGPARSSLRPS